MKVEQIYKIVNTMTNEILGESVVVNEDLSNIVDVGKALLDSADVNAILGKAIDQVGRMVFVDRVYSGRAPSVLRDGWEYGSIVEKFRGVLPDAVQNDTWSLTSGQTVDPFVYTAPEISVKLFNSRTTFEVDLTVLDVQLKDSFQNVTQLNRFLSMLYNEVDKKMTVALDSLIMATIRHGIADTLIDAQGESKTALGDISTSRAVNLLKLFNEGQTTPIKANEALKNKEFLRFAGLQMKKYVERMGGISELFNVGGTSKFTPKDLLHVVLLSDLKNGAETYLQSDTFHDMLVALPKAETVTYWQGSGTDYSFESISAIDVTTKSGTVKTSGILGVMFDHDAIAVCNDKRRVTTQYNAKGEFTNLFYKMDVMYLNDLDENLVVFYVADPSPAS